MQIFFTFYQKELNCMFAIYWRFGRQTETSRCVYGAFVIRAQHIAGSSSSTRKTISISCLWWYQQCTGK